MKEYTVLPGQSLFDVAVAIYGDVMGVIWLIDDNNLYGPTDRIQAGQVLKIRAGAMSARTRDYLQAYPPLATITPAEQPEGVSFWRVDEYQVQ